jgi:hypothetical protein
MWLTSGFRQDLVGAAGRCVGVLPTQTYDQSKGEPVTSVCQLQAFGGLRKALAITVNGDHSCRVGVL